MNAVEIADAVADMFAQPFDASEFPFAFLEAFGNKEVTIKRLRKGDSNSSDVRDGVLQKNNIHMAVCGEGQVGETLQRLKVSPKNSPAKVKFILATDGQALAAEDLRTGEALECDFTDTPSYFGFFLELAGISTVKEIKDNPIDIRATGRLNKLYLELLKENSEWQKPERRLDLNHFFARLIFCFFAEDTGIFHGDALFTDTVRRMTQPDGSNTDQVLEKLFEAMNVSVVKRKSSDLPLWALPFPYVNGGLFGDRLDVPRFSRIARSYLLRAGELNWRKINPDIFGSMIQAVADDEERGALGMHYTSVPNILKVLNPLFLDELRAQLEAAGDNGVKLLNLRKRMARIRVFDPACGSGNFLVIAYREMRAIEAEINRRRGEEDRPSEIHTRNFCGIEIRDFAAEVARLALIIAEYQADVLYRGERLALAEFLPLDKENWILKGNALRLDWTTVCPPLGSVVKVRADNLFEEPLDQTEMNFANEGGETYICGNPPYKGSRYQTTEMKADISALFKGRTRDYAALDYVTGWFLKAADYGRQTVGAAAFVATNSICQGEQVGALWPLLFSTGHYISFCHTSFKWTNLAAHNAGVTVVIVGLSSSGRGVKRIYSEGIAGDISVREAEYINAYLVAGPNVIVRASSTPPDERATMRFGNHPYYGASLIFTSGEAQAMLRADTSLTKWLRPLYGSRELIDGSPRACFWIEDDDAISAATSEVIATRMKRVRAARMAATSDEAAQKLAKKPYRFRDQYTSECHTLVVPRISSESRRYMPAGLLESHCIVQDQAFALYDAAIWHLALISSRLHLVWIGTVCGKLKTDYRYSNTLGWNTFPVPPLTQGQKDLLTRCAEEILLARERHWPATIAELYDPEGMPEDLRRAHDRNDETLERIYIGRRFKNDTERLEKLFEMYTTLTSNPEKKGLDKLKSKRATRSKALL